MRSSVTILHGSTEVSSFTIVEVQTILGTNDPVFQSKVLASSVHGTTYVGRRARTTGAPQNHWFGPCGDPRAAGIGTPEAIISTWSGHREIILDQGPLPQGWRVPGSAWDPISESIQEVRDGEDRGRLVEQWCVAAAGNGDR